MTTWTVTISGVSEALAQTCAGINGTYDLTLINGVWRGVHGYIRCDGPANGNPGVSGTGGITLVCRPADGLYRLDIIDYVIFATYTAPVSGWDCEGCNTMSLVYSDPYGCCTYPGTVEVCAGGGGGTPFMMMSVPEPEPENKKPCNCGERPLERKQRPTT